MRLQSPRIPEKESNERVKEDHTAVLSAVGIFMAVSATPDSGGDLLELQGGRRCHHIPTISVLAGPPLAGLRRWRAWLVSSQHPSVITNRTAPKAVIRLLATALAQHRDLAADALVALANWCGLSAAEVQARLAAKTTADLDVFLETLPVDRSQDLVATTVRLVRWWHQGKLPGPAQLLDRLREALPWPEPAELRRLTALTALVPEAAWPALFLMSEALEGQGSWLIQASRTAAAIASQLPAFPIGLTARPDVVNHCLRTEAESQALALVREGLIVLPSVERSALCRRVEEMGLDAAAAAPAIEAVLARGADAELVTRLAEATSAVAALGEARVEADDHARSQAERFLYELLDSHPSTAGLFELNGLLDFRFGPRPAEVDLLARIVHLAVEIDGGYWHLRDPQSYRRDRRKDWELQRRGFLVLRFLAEDVVYRPSEIMDTILAAVAYQQRPAPQAGEKS